MLKLILGDFCTFDQNQVSSTLRNSLLSILNRYLIRFSGPFFNYLENIQLPFPTFLQAYIHNMEHLTSHTAMYLCVKIEKLIRLLFCRFLMLWTVNFFCRIFRLLSKSHFLKWKITIYLSWLELINLWLESLSTVLILDSVLLSSVKENSW